MDVFILYNGNYDDRYIVGVYGSLEDAQSIRHSGHVGKWSELDENGTIRCEWVAHHHRAQMPAEVILETRTIPVIDGVATLPDGRLVQTSSAFVSVPWPPPTFTGPIASWETGCSYSIEQHPVFAGVHEPHA